MSEQLEDQSCKTPSLEEVSLKSELMKQKQEMIDCLQDELIKVRGNFTRENSQLLSQVRLREAENEAAMSAAVEFLTRDMPQAHFAPADDWMMPRMRVCVCVLEWTW